MTVLEKDRISLYFERIQAEEHSFLSSLLVDYSELIIEDNKSSYKYLINLLYEYYNAAKQHMETDFHCFLRNKTDNFFEIHHHFELFLLNLKDIIEKYEAGEKNPDFELFDYISMNNTGHLIQHSETI